jgi:hypothetical protein
MWKQWEQEAEATSPLKQNLEDEVRKERDSLMEWLHGLEEGQQERLYFNVGR